MSSVYRIMILAILPVVALLMYYRGQHYDPALLNFNPSSSVIDTITGFFPAEIETLTQDGQIRTYTRENLYEYVNGHAEYFISSGFIQLAVGEYSTGSNDDPDIVIDIYDMGNSIQAFGILSDESGGNITDMKSGLSGFRTPQGTGFIKGQYYIKITTFSRTVPVDNVMESLNSRISAEADPFPEFADLPDIGQIVKTRFIKEAYRGLDFVNNVIEREYSIQGKTLQVFILKTKKENIREKAASFISYFNDSDIDFTESKEGDKTIYKVSDPYEGDWVLISSPDTIMGIFGSYTDTLINSIIK
ncbi:MAG: hypothetical protein JSW20_11295 [Nitrospiraceae bacterium]|nr:MAG: hypothetical protein JSW20_11295 [Nitrospiraceae bacterium]